MIPMVPCGDVAWSCNADAISCGLHGFRCPEYGGEVLVSSSAREARQRSSMCGCRAPNARPSVSPGLFRVSDACPSRQRDPPASRRVASAVLSLSCLHLLAQHGCLDVVDVLFMSFVISPAGARRGICSERTGLAGGGRPREIVDYFFDRRF